jgi:diguanylate cyclase (GGDEF)-like protein/PAS domain S-box-containing protein
MFIDGRQYLSGFFRDVTQRRHTEQQLRIAAVAFESQEGMLIADASCHILRVNRAFSDITGYAAKDAIGHSPKLLNATRHDEPLYETIWETATQTGEWAGEMESQRKNGETYFAHFTLTAVRSDRGLITHYVGTISDITERKASSEKIRQLAFYDPLTHLPNRLLLTERLQHALETQARDGKGGALLFIDLDGFKSINDTLGHDMGDLLLQSVANRLMMCVRESDTVARLGGDEFIVMLEGFSGYGLEVAAQVEAVAHKILDTLNRPHHLGAHTLRSSCSIGVILFSDHAETQEELLKQADIAMYQAKKAGRNTLRFFDPVMQTNINARVSLENELHEALQHQQFELYYQIQVDSDRQSIGAEGLIRWHHPQLGLLQPMRFIPLAEESKLIVYIGKWVLETACAQLAAWQQDALTRHLVLSVNVSAQQFHQTSFVQQVHAAVQFHAIHPSRLKLELTESILLENINSTIATMNALKEIGIQFSLDDFGTGYSSLQYLKCLPINQLKIDQSFVRDIEFDNSDQVIVRTIIVMAQSLGLEVIAEGVENAVQERLLLQNGCTYYQGYRFSQPLPIAEFEALIQQNRSDAGFTPS